MDAIHVKRERERLQQIIRVQQAVIKDVLALLSEQGYAEQRIIAEVKKGQFVQVFLRLWSKESPEGRLQRFYVTGGLK